MPEPIDSPGTLTRMPKASLPILLYLTQRDGALIAIDATAIYLMRPAEREPHNIDWPMLTRVFISVTGGATMAFDVRETVEQIGGLLTAIAEGAAIKFTPDTDELDDEAVNEDA